jgi:16S rRNA (guanine1207-N2)-methyltransferase
LTEHYFTSSPVSAHRTRSFLLDYQGERFSFETDAGVFSGDALDEGTRLMLDAAIPHLSGKVLDLGCGWGPAGIIAGRLRPDCRVTMSDINERACALAVENARRNKVQADVLQGDGLSAVQGDFDWILFNPPIRAGKQAVYALFRQAGDRLNAGGTFAVVIRKHQGAASANTFLEGMFSSASLALRKRGFHVYFCREAIG